jgi:ligand-binding sensor domain-containing protein
MRITRAISQCSSLFFLLLVARNGLALDPNKRITQYRHNASRLQDGFLPSNPEWISQISDGYLWVGSNTMGAFRFDGNRFLPSPAPPSVTNQVNRINARAGGFWVVEPRGVTHLIGNRVIARFDLHGEPYPIVEDADGSVWVGLVAREGAAGPLCHVTDMAARCFGEADGINFERADSLLLDGKGGLWIGTDTALVHWKSGRSTMYECKALRSNVGQDGIVSLAANPDGSLWVGIAGVNGPGLGLQRFIGDHFRPFFTRGFDGSKIEVRAFLQDRNQNLWIASDNHGVYRIRAETVDHFGTADGLSGDTVFALREDREGIIWAATSNGLDSFRDRDFTTFSRSEGLSQDGVESVLASRDGTLWLANNGSLDQIKNGQVFSA